VGFPLFVCPCPRSLGWFVRTAGIPRKRRQHSGEQPLLQVSFVDIRHFFFPFCRFLVVYIIPTRTGELNSNHPQSPVRVESIHMMGFCLMPRRNRLRHCYHILASVDHPSMLPHSATRAPRVGFWRGLRC
jgi:hypothetical protein